MPGPQPRGHLSVDLRVVAGIREDDDTRVNVDWGLEVFMGSWGERVLMHTSIPIIIEPCDL